MAAMHPRPRFPPCCHVKGCKRLSDPHGGLQCADPHFSPRHPCQSLYCDIRCKVHTLIFLARKATNTLMISKHNVQLTSLSAPLTQEFLTDLTARYGRTISTVISESSSSLAAHRRGYVEFENHAQAEAFISATKDASCSTALQGLVARYSEEPRVHEVLSKLPNDLAQVILEGVPPHFEVNRILASLPVRPLNCNPLQAQPGQKCWTIPYKSRDDAVIAVNKLSTYTQGPGRFNVRLRSTYFQHLVRQAYRIVGSAKESDVDWPTLRSIRSMDKEAIGRPSKSLPQRSVISTEARDGDNDGTREKSPQSGSGSGEAYIHE